jgi:allophanate hydrolase
MVADTERLDRLRARALAELSGSDALLLPTAPWHPTLAEVAADPIGSSSRLGAYTNFVNLLGLCAVAVPAGQADDGPFGVTVIGRAFADHVAADIARLLTPAPAVAPAAPALPLVVAGACLADGSLGNRLAGRGGRLAGTVDIAGHFPMRPLSGPGAVRGPGGGRCLRGELWLLPPAVLGAFLAELPGPAALTRLTLDDGTVATGLLCE